MRTILFSITCLFATMICYAQTSPTCGLMVMAHGGTEEWNTAVQNAVAPVRDQIPTAIAFGMADHHTMKVAVEELEGHNVDCIAVVRLFMSAHSFLHQTEYLLGLRSDPPPFFISHHGPSHGHPPPSPVESTVEIKISQTALLDAPEMGEILALNATSLSDSSGAESVLIIAHGSGDDAVNDEWMQKLDDLSNTVRETGLFREVAVQSLREDWEDKRVKSEAEIRNFVETHSSDDGRVIVLPFRLYGFGPYASVLEGLSYESNGIGLLPHEKVTSWIERTAQELFLEFQEEDDTSDLSDA